MLTNADDGSRSTSRSPSRLRRLAALAVGGALVLAGCSADQEPEPSIERTRDVGVQLFQWSWDAIAAECTDNLGPAGFSWVLTSPPNEHILGEQWWTSYQPVSYQVESRLGTREQFEAMVSTCADAGVGIVADAVINHMAGQEDPGTGWAGSAYEHYEYPGIYSDADGDFHHCGTLNDDIHNYRDVEEVQNCELSNLADLATGTEHVRDTIVAYLEDLLSLGVAGFRIDAAKHIPVEDIEAIISQLPADIYVVQEVIRGAGEPIRPEHYAEVGRVFEFGFGRDLIGYVGGSTFEGFLKLGEGTGWLPSEVADVFVDNHDTERNASTLNYSAGRGYELANVLMLAGEYGTPVVYSGYAFSDRDAGPAQTAQGEIIAAACTDDTGPEAEYDDGEWVCQHRWPGISGMIGWRAAAGTEPITVSESDDSNVLAFSRGQAAFIAINRAKEPASGSWQTALPSGMYCNIAHGPVTSQGCVGEPVEVAEDGTIEAELPAVGFVALHVDARA